MNCTVCGVECAERLHGFAVAPLCPLHADWLDDEIAEVPETLTTDGRDWYIDGDTWEALVERMREDHAASLAPVMRHDPLDGVSLGGAA